MHPVLFSIGAFSVYSYGTLVAAGYLVAALWLWRDERRKGQNPAPLLDLGMGILLSGLVGGRVLYVLLHLGTYLRDPLEAFKIHHGGLVFYGGWAGAILFVLYFVRRKGLPLWPTFDRMVPYVALAHAVGRIGCFTNGCCYGKPTAFFLGVVFPGETFPRHPTQLYESFFLFLLFFLLRGLGGRRDRLPGAVAGVYFGAYGTFRFFVEFFRGDQTPFLWGWTLPQLLSLFLLVFPLFLFRGRRAR